MRGVSSINKLTTAIDHNANGNRINLNRHVLGLSDDAILFTRLFITTKTREALIPNRFVYIVTSWRTSQTFDFCTTMMNANIIRFTKSITFRRFKSRRVKNRHLTRRQIIVPYLLCMKSNTIIVFLMFYLETELIA